MSIPTPSPTLLETVRNVLITYKATLGTPVSLADVTKVARVEPITLVSSNLTTTKELYNILHGVLNIYTSYYLQAISLLSAELVDARILKILDKTNPDRDIKTMLASGYRTSFESLNTLTLENCKYKLPTSSVSIEAFNNNRENPLGSSVNKISTFDKVPNAVGKIVEVKFKVRGNTEFVTTPAVKNDNGGIKTPAQSKPLPASSDEVAIPVVVKLDTMVIPNEVIDAIMVTNKNEITLTGRFKDAINGRIRFIRDFILCSDLIKAQKKSMIKDPTGYYNQVLNRINNSRFISALTGNMSLAGVSSIVVISDEDENHIARYLGGKLTNRNTRNIVFDNISAMMIVVVNKDWERVDIYVRDIDGFSQNNYDDFKLSADKGSSDQILDVLKAFNLGNAPVF